MALINGTNANDFLLGTAVADQINGLAGDDILIGLGGNDILNGGAGADLMIGGTGDDDYVVNAAGDVVVEGDGEGTDRILSAISLSLTAPGRLAVENLTLIGPGNLNGFGNALNNVITGNVGNNTLFGLDGNDTLFGLGGVDTLFGGNGNDNLVGGQGADDMIGGLGNDVYSVDNVGDQVTENFNEGIDTIVSSISTSLNIAGRLDVENLTLVGIATNGTGNGQNNVINGNGANNLLQGLAGNDTINGNFGNDDLRGGVGNDLLNGGLGNDVIRTGAGNDTVLFNSPLGAANADAILDFNVPTDTIFVENAVFVGLAAGALPGGAFFIGAAAAAADDRIIYDSTTGDLSFDADGTGAAAQQIFANVDVGLALTAADFVVV